MKKLDGFIVKAFVGPFIAILLVVIFILLMQFLWLYIDELVGKGLSLLVIFEFMMWGGCTILPLALPLATLLSSMMTVGSMAENNELMAIKASGVSFSRVILPIMICCAIISLGAFFTADKLVPLAFNKIYTLRDDIGRTKAEIKIPAGTFYDGIDGYVLRIGRREAKSGMMYDVMVYDHTRERGNNALTIADSAMMKMSGSKDYLIFTLYDGVNYSETNSKSYTDTTLQLQKVDFRKQEMVIPLTNYAFRKSDDARFGDQVKSMELKQLLYYKDSLDTKVDSYHKDHYNSLIANTTFYRYKQLDTSFRPEAFKNFHAEDYLKWTNLAEQIQAYQRAADNANQLASTLQSYERDIYEPVFYLRRTDIEILKKYSGALACFILFFIGAPLGALIRKGGLGVSAIVSALFFVLYWVVDISGVKLAKDGAVGAVTGAFISSYVLFPIGMFISYIAIKDKQLFDNDTLLGRWRKLKTKFMGFFKKTRIVYMGTPEFAVAPLDALVKKGFDIVGVVTVADKPSGRGLKVNESAVKKYAVEHNIPVLQPIKLKDPEFLGRLAALKADLFVVVAFRMLPEEVWTMPRLGTFNLHAALLPQYRGAAPINWAVINGERMTGVTTFMIDKDIDTGRIILREECRIGETDSAGDVHDKLMEIGSELVLETVEGIVENNVETRVQRSFIQGTEVLKPAPKLSKELCHIDWNDTSENIYNLIRGLSPFPTAYTELTGSGTPLSLKIYSAEKMALETPGTPGRLLSDGCTYLAVTTADGALSLKDVQLAGKKRMGIEEFLRGFREPEKYICSEGSSKLEIEKTKR